MDWRMFVWLLRIFTVVYFPNTFKLTLGAAAAAAEQKEEEEEISVQHICNTYPTFVLCESMPILVSAQIQIFKEP